MIESIEFSQGVLRLTVASTRPRFPGERECRIELNFGERGTVTELHGGELVNFIYPVYPEGAHEIRNLVLELLSTHARVSRIDLYCFYGASEGLEGSTATDEDVKLARGTV